MQEDTIIGWAQSLAFAMPEVLCGMGDDAAVLLPPAGQPLLVSTDMLVEDVHFSSRLSAHAVGWKSLAVNLSDLAAMGGKPMAYLLSLGLPPDTPESWVKAFFQGLYDCAQQYPINLIGGDTVRSPVSKVVNITVLGSCHRPVYRTGAQPGDRLVVTGDFGAAAAGLSVIQQQRETDYPSLFQRQAYPVPRLAEAQQLVAQCSRLALLDTSDGLGRSLQLICQLNQVGCQVDLKDIPVLPEVKSWSQECQHPWEDWVIHGGEEYELMAAVPPEEVGQLKPPFRVIGTLTPHSGIHLMTAQGTLTLDESPVGFQHL